MIQMTTVVNTNVWTGLETHTSEWQSTLRQDRFYKIYVKKGTILILQRLVCIIRFSISGYTDLSNSAVDL
jgi:hypothetical protein